MQTKDEAAMTTGQRSALYVAGMLVLFFAYWMTTILVVVPAVADAFGGRFAPTIGQAAVIAFWLVGYNAAALAREWGSR